MTTTTCDLCHCESDRLSVVENLWGMGESAICVDESTCSSAWAPAFEATPAGEPVETDGPFAVNPDDTEVVCYGQTFDSLDKAEPKRSTPTRRIVRALID